MKKLSVVFPVYNEKENIPHLYRRVTEAFKNLSYGYEIVLVNDGSSDNSAELLAEISKKDPRWKLLSFSRNFGHQTAISAGIYYASGDVIAIMDSDLQDPPEVLNLFLDKWAEGYQVVYAIRTKRKESWLKKLSYFLFYRILKKIAAIDIPLDAGDFCVMDRVVVDVLNQLPERGRFVRGLRSWAGFKQIGVSYERDSRFAGTPKYTLTRLLKLAFDGIVSFSSFPLRLASMLGVLSCFVSLLVVLLIMIWKYTNFHFFGMAPNQVLGWTSLFSTILFVSGIQMLLLGAIGEYLGRVFSEVKNRDPWIISDAVGFDQIQYRQSKGWYANHRS